MDIRCLFRCFGLGLSISGLPLAGGNPEVLQDPSLVETVLFGLAPIQALKTASHPASGRICVEAYLKAVPRDSPLRKARRPPDQTKSLEWRRKNLQEQMVVCLGGSVGEEARRFARAVPLQLEWEGMSEGPLAEADFGMQWLRTYPDTPLAPFLHLFAAHRYRAAFEAAQAGLEKGLWPVLAKRYREEIAMALAAPSPLIHCIAEELERQSHVYLEGHPLP